LDFGPLQKRIPRSDCTAPVSPAAPDWYHFPPSLITRPGHPARRRLPRGVPQWSHGV